MKRTIAWVACLGVVATACGSSDDSNSASLTEATEAAPAETEPITSEPEPTTPPEPEPEPTTLPEPEPEPETTTATEPAPALNVVGLAPFPAHN